MNVFESAIPLRDGTGNICQFNHADNPYRADIQAIAAAGGAENQAASSVRAIADAYLMEAIPHFGLNAQMFAVEGDEQGINGTPDGEELVFESTKSVMGNSRVVYNQMLNGVPVWESGMVVQVEEAPMQVIGSQCSMKRELKLEAVRSDAKFAEKKITDEFVRKLFGIPVRDGVKVMPASKFAYQYDPQRRIQVAQHGPNGEQVAKIPFALPLVSQEIKEGQPYFVSAFEFTIDSTQEGATSWLALVEQQSGSVLMIRSLSGCCHCAITGTRVANPVANGNQGVAIAVNGRPSVVFFDIGDTLGTPVVVGGQLTRIDLFADAFEVVKELFEKGSRVGVISDPGNLSTDLIESLLQDTGILEFIDRDLIVFGVKNSKTIFERAATTAGVAASDCLYVGESSFERGFAEEAGFSSVNAPDRSISIIDPDAAIAWVYLRDPVTKLGAAGPSPTSSPQVLDLHRDLVSLVGLKKAAIGSQQNLIGEYVRLVNIDDPNPTIPTSPLPGDFRYSVNTNDFGAVNAYYNCDRLYRILEGFGIVVKDYFDGTTFPVDVDHRVRFRGPDGLLTANSVNAQAPGGTMPPRSMGFQFALAALNTSVGMALDWRVVLHEFGHALLWDNIGSPNFRFAHSAGDALAAILNDAGNKNTRGATFPWTGIGRSHLRPVTDYAWYGTRYQPFIATGADWAGYIAEQMLSSTLFRLYQAAGGDSADRKTQEFAAAYVVFLVVKSIGLMSPANNPQRPEGFADLMIQADTGKFLHLGREVEIGVLRKVIRWAFELQGAYRQPPTNNQLPTNQVGNPPQVDVFINDGRDGHYQFTETLDSRDIWNRHVADNGTVHQDPVAGQVGFAYVRLSNRGLTQASNVEVRAYQSPIVAEQIWPTDWDPLIDAVLSSPNIAPGSSTVVGPFKWVPSSIRPTLLMTVSAMGDQSNASRFSSANPIANRRLVPQDNNIAQRSVTAT